MKVKLEREKKTKSIKYSGSVHSLLKKLKINPETVLIVRNDELLTKEDKLKDSDTIEILTVFSGG